LPMGCLLVGQIQALPTSAFGNIEDLILHHLAALVQEALVQAALCLYNLRHERMDL
jgi:hypothetical protein